MNVKDNYSVEISDDAQDIEMGDKQISFNFLCIGSTAIVVDMYSCNCDGC